jgi:hypothetical protein
MKLMMESAKDEQRRYARIPVAWPVRLWVDDEPIIGHAQDASRYGLGVAIGPTATVKLGCSYWVEILAEGAGRLAVAAEVRYIRGRTVGLEVKRPIPLSEMIQAAGSAEQGTTRRAS